MAHRRAQYLAQFVDMVGHQRRRFLLILVAAAVEKGVEAIEHLAGCLDEVDQAGAHRRERHAVIARAFRRLDQAYAAMFLDRAQADRAVCSGAGKDHAGGVALLVGGEREEEVVDRAAKPARLGEVGQFQPAAADNEAAARWDDIDLVRLDRLAALALEHLEAGLAVEQLGEHAFVVGIEMLNDHERHAGRRAGRGEHLAQRLEPTGGGADADDRQRRRLGVERRVQRKPPVSRSASVIFAWAMVAAVLAMVISVPSTAMPLSATTGASRAIVCPSAAS